MKTYQAALSSNTDPESDNTRLGNICPLCKKIQSSLYHIDKNRQYLQCSNCYLVYVPEDYHLTIELEKSQYDFHNNSPLDQRYRNFLSRLFNPVSERLSGFAKGLDFGSGPGPALSVMFEEQGHKMSIYDKFYAHDDSVLECNYDFITVSEVIEHLGNPQLEIERLLSILKPGGYLGIMTKLVKSRLRFQNWHYKNDLTHICFYSRETFNWLAKKYHLNVEFIDADVIILSK